MNVLNGTIDNTSYYDIFPLKKKAVLYCGDYPLSRSNNIQK